MKTLFGAALIIFAASAHAQPVVYQRLKVAGTVAHVITVNLNDRSVIVVPALAARGRGSSERFVSIIARTRPTAAVTGTFFDTRSLLPTGDIVIEGKRVHPGLLGTAICIDSENRIHLVRRKRGCIVDWSRYDSVLGGGLTLVEDGKICLDPASEGFRDPSLRKRVRRIAVGATEHNKLLLVAINRPVGLYQTASVMKALKAVDAVLLDGGSSAGLYANGCVMVAPSRRLTNTLQVFVGEEHYARARLQLAPTLIKADTPTPRLVRLAEWPKTLARSRDRDAARERLQIGLPGISTENYAPAAISP